MLLRRRDVLLGTLALAACRQKEDPPPRPTGPRTRDYDGVEMIELFPHDADESSPIIVAVHGMGDRPERWVDDWQKFPARARIALPRAFHPYSGGFSWFALRDGMTDEELGAGVGAAEERLWKGIAKLAAGKRVIVTGFSQGGILSFAMASRHPNEVIRAFPVAGSCPGPLLPKGKAAPLLAFHGTEDKLLELRWGREAVNAFKERGNDAAIREYPGIPHAISPEMHRDLWDAIVKTLGS
jgi:phospholipase/carboxylesterase